jgi:hypothetical protein
MDTKARKECQNCTSMSFSFTMSTAKKKKILKKSDQLSFKNSLKKTQKYVKLLELFK